MMHLGVEHGVNTVCVQIQQYYTVTTNPGLVVSIVFITGQ